MARVGELVDDRRGDVRDAEAVRDGVRRARPEVVFHLAAHAIVRASLENPAVTYEVNVVGHRAPARRRRASRRSCA